KNWESQSRFVLKTCSEHGIPKQFTDIVNDGKENIGFLVFSGCGNPFRGDYDFVRINDKWPELEIVSKISKSKPVFRATDNPNIVEMWTVDQRFPNGVGTSLSFFVPIVYKFSRSGDGLSHEDRRPPEKIASWPIFEYAFDFRSYFASGLMMMDDRVLSQAVDLYFDSQKAVGYRELGLPASKEDAAKVISAVKTLSEYYDNYPMPCRH
ncbi:MAG: hypothetical protein NTV34_04250, partial [Proteobacteria bacterium]|nr:hypothetical protein [Pseudomonadota bacterium]